MKKSALLFSLIFMSYLASGQNHNIQWQIKPQTSVNDALRKIAPETYLLTHIDNNILQAFLFNLNNARDNSQIITIPNPNGEMETFYIWESSIMELDLQNRYPHIRTYTGIKTDAPHVTAKFDYTEYGFHAMIFSDAGTYYIDPLYYQKSDEYQVYFKSDFTSSKPIHPCSVSNDNPETSSSSIEIYPDFESTVTPLRNHGHVKKEYRLALSCTGEYAQAVTGETFPSKSEVFSAMVTTMNRVNGIYEKELSVKMVFIADNDDVIYTNPSSDPYTANNNGGLLMSQNQSNMSSVIGLSNFDIGHIFSTGGGGIASLASVCVNSQKARGVTGSDEPYGDPYDVDYVAHEIGHQFGANHSFNNCDGNENTSTAYEPGSGSTIMSYAGLCGAPNNLQNNSHDYFHNASLNEISRYISGVSHGGSGTCGTSTTGSTNITLPSYSGTYYIPRHTAFEVIAPDASWGSLSSTLTYSWEQHDLGQVGRNETLGATATTAPVFRSYISTIGGKYRSFPHADSVHRNVYNFRGERMPTRNRTIKTKVTVRGVDATGFGSFIIGTDLITVHIVNDSTAFVVTSPNTGSESYNTGSTITVTWDPGSSTSAPVSSSAVDIFLSIDGGKTYPFTLATAVENSGSASVTIPEGSATSQARIKVKGNNNIFYDVSNFNFTILSGSTDVSQINPADIKLYPNPVAEILNISYENIQDIESIKIINVLGQEVFSSNGSQIKSQINVSQLSPGYYTIKLYNGVTHQIGVQSFMKL